MVGAHRGEERLRTWQHLVLGGLSGAVAASVTMPLGLRENGDAVRVADARARAAGDDAQGEGTARPVPRLGVCPRQTTAYAVLLLRPTLPPPTPRDTLDKVRATRAQSWGADHAVFFFSSCHPMH